MQYAGYIFTTDLGWILNTSTLTNHWHSSLRTVLDVPFLFSKEYNLSPTNFLVLQQEVSAANISILESQW